jgi:PAS domain S-box-containing protein
MTLRVVVLGEEHNSDKWKLETDLRIALERDEFYLKYQPKLELHSGKVTGVEALILWEHPEKGVVSPLEFIPLAEETGMITELGEWVLLTACRQNKAWQEMGMPPMIVAVNLSPRQFHQSNLIEMVQRILKETGLSPEYLELEITESMTMDVQTVLPIIRDLKRIGIRISLDDFGKGYSSLYYLKEFPIDIVKIDQCFVQNCTSDTKDATIVRAILAMAHQLKVEVIAEGIETKDQLIFLQQNICNKGQGYFFSKPLLPDELIQKFYDIEHIVHREGIPVELNRQKWLEKELENSRQELRDTMRLQQGMIFKYVERNGRFIHTLCDGELLYRIGLSPEKLFGKELYDVLTKDEAERKLQYYKRAWAGEENVTYEGKLNGVWYLASLRPIRKGGQIVEVIVSCVDITERKESEERYQRIIEYSPKGIVIHRNGNILYANPAALKIINEEEYSGKSVFTYIHPDYHKITLQRASQANAGEELPIIEIELIRQNGEIINAELGSVAIPYDGESATLAIFSDITLRKKVEKELEESKERYQSLLNLSPEPIVVHSQGIIQYINQAGVKILGFTQPEELLGKFILDYFHPDSRQKVAERIQRLQQQADRHVEPLEYLMMRSDGTIFYVEWTAIGISYGGKPAIQGIFRDITARKQIEEALRQSEEKYRLIAENMQDLIGVLDTNGVVQYASPSHKTILGFSPEVYEGNAAFNFVYPDDVPPIQKEFADMVATKTSCSVEFRYKHANGGWVYVEAVGTPVLDEKNEVNHLVVVARNISERKKAEELIRKSEKLSVVGQLAAGVAHEIRNPLTSIKGFVQLLQKEVDKPLYTETILSEISRLDEIVKSFLSLAKPQPAFREENDIKIILQEVIRLFESQALLNNVEIVQEPRSDLPIINCDGNQMKQVFINILQNAVEAMPNGGLISIEISRPIHDFITIKFSDQGHGIPEERIKKIGEPFFSTKEKGTGLGLMITQKIVQEHGGTINIESKLNEGTVVEVILPIQQSF